MPIIYSTQGFPAPSSSFVFGWIFEFFEIFLDFFWFLWIPYKGTKVTTKSYQGYYWKPKIAKIVAKQHNNNVFFFARRAKKSLAIGRSPPQEPEEGLRNGPYLLVILMRES